MSKAAMDSARRNHELNPNNWNVVTPPGRVVEIVPVKRAVDSQLQMMTDQWPAETALNLLDRIRGDLATEMARIEGMAAWFRGGDTEDGEAA